MKPASMPPLFLDIETIPSQAEGFLDELRASMMDKMQSQLASVEAPKNYKDEIKIAEYCATERARISASFESQVMDAYHATALDGTFGDVFCVAVAINDDDPPCTISLFEIGNLTRSQIIGHNIAWDIRFIWQYCVRNNRKLPKWWPIDAKPWDETIFCTMTRWCGVGSKISLAKLAKALGVEGKTQGVDGSKVWGLVQAGETETVREYCRQDVRMVRDIWRKMTNQGDY